MLPTLNTPRLIIEHMMRHGTLPSGFDSWILLSGPHTSSRSR